MYEVWINEWMDDLFWMEYMRLMMIYYLFENKDNYNLLQIINNSKISGKERYQEQYEEIYWRFSHLFD